MRHICSLLVLICSIVTGATAFSLDIREQDEKLRQLREAILRHTILPAAKVKGVFSETILFGSAGLPAGTQIHSEIVCTWNKDRLQGLGCQKKNPTYNPPIQYVAPQSRNQIDYTQEGHLIVHRWIETSVLNVPSGIFLIENLESIKIAPTNEVVAVGQSKVITVWSKQSILWADALWLATGRIPKQISDSFGQVRQQSDDIVVLTLQNPRVPLTWRMQINAKDHWLVRRVDALNTNGDIIYTIQTHGMLIEKTSNQVIAKGAEIIFGNNKFSIRFTDWKPEPDIAFLKELHHQIRDASATIIDHRTGSISLPYGQPVETHNPLQSKGQK